MPYDLVDRPLPKQPSSDTKHGRTKYPFADLPPINPKTGKGKCLPIEGEKDVQLALIRMRAFARDNNARFVTEKERGDDGKVHKVYIWRLE